MPVLPGAVKQYTLFILTMCNSLYDSLETRTDICESTIYMYNHEILTFCKQNHQNDSFLINQGFFYELKWTFLKLRKVDLF